jgi:hypothetical protein
VLGKKFCAHHGIDKTELILKLRSTYLLDAGVEDDDSTRKV